MVDNKITMSKKELVQFKVLSQFLEGIVTQKDAANQLNLSVRQVRRKAPRLKLSGPEGLTHKSRGRPSSRALSQEKIDIIVAKIKADFSDFGPTFAAEKLAKDFNLKINRETLRKIMIEAGFWIPRSVRPKHRKRRPRKANFGQMVQLDGSYHDWFEGRREKCTLLVFIDDATGKIVWLEFAESESFVAVATATRNYTKQVGAPASFYVDHGSVFHVNTNNLDHAKLTQFEMILARLNIQLIKAKTPQAKGRVERCNKTLQDRLVKELRLEKICDIFAANKFIKDVFLPDFNEKFKVKAAEEKDLHRQIENLEEQFYATEKRTIFNDFVINYNARTFQLKRMEHLVLRPRMKVEVRYYIEGQIKLFYKNNELDFVEIFSAKPAPEINRANEPSSQLRLTG